MQIRLFIDEDATSRALINGLRARGVDVTIAREEGRAGLDDAQQLEYASQQGRTIYTHNISDFYRLHTEYLSQGKTHAGIIFSPQQRFSVGEQMRRLLVLMSVKSAEAMKDEAEFLSDWQ